MSEQHIEAEIAALSKAIELKRRALEEARGIVPENKEIIKETLAEKFGGERTTQAPAVTASPTATSAPTPTPTATKTSSSYLGSLTPEATHKVNMLIETVGSKGIKAAVEAAQDEDPFVMDAFHDALVDRMYDELKSRGIVK